MPKKEIERSERFILYYQLGAVVDFLEKCEQTTIGVNSNVFFIIKNIIDASRKTYKGDILNTLPEIPANKNQINKDELLLIAKIYLSTAEAFMTEEEKSLIMQSLTIASKFLPLVIK